MKTDPLRILDDALDAIRNETVDPALVRGSAARAWAEISQQLAEVDMNHVTPIQGCAGIQALAEPYRAGTLPEARMLLIKDHLSQCVACRKVIQGKPAAIELNPRRGPLAAWPLRWAIAATVIVAVALASWYLFNQLGPAPSGPAATIASLDGALFRMAGDQASPLKTGAAISSADRIRTAKGSAAVIRLRDGSQIEVRERSDFSIAEGAGNVTIQLARGGIIVEAAKRRTGHLYVSTRDCRVAVTGTVFSVSSGTKGSRVSVIEGEVRIDQGARERVLRPGQQYASNAAMEPLAVSREIAWSTRAADHVNLLREVTALGQEMDQQVKLPAVRYSPDLVKYLPPATVVYAALPNLGESLAQANEVFERKLGESAVLREWWQQKASHAPSETRLGSIIDDVRRFSAYLGEEIVVAAALNEQGKPGDPVLLARLRQQSGFIEFVQAEMAKRGAGAIRVFRSRSEIAPGAGDELLLYLRTDAIAISSNWGMLSQVAAAMEGAVPVATPFTSQIVQAYREGVEFLVCADLGSMAANSREDAEDANIAGNVKFLVASQKQVAGKPDTRATLTFDGPRQGLASWLAEPSASGALDYVSPDASIVYAFTANDFATVLDQLIAKAPGMRDNITKAEAELGISIRNDLAATLGGDFVVALDGPVLPVPSWKIIAEVYNPARLQSTIQSVVDAANRKAASSGETPVQLTQETAGGRTYHSISIPSGKPLSQLVYTFTDGFLVAAPSRALADRAIQNRTAGTSFVRSAQFTNLLPRDSQTDFSALVYHSFGAATQALGKVAGAEHQEALAQLAKPTLVLAYAADDRITLASTAAFLGITPSNLFGLRLPMALSVIHERRSQAVKQ